MDQEFNNQGGATLEHLIPYYKPNGKQNRAENEAFAGTLKEQNKLLIDQEVEILLRQLNTH